MTRDNIGLIVRVVLRLVALAATAYGFTTEKEASAIFLHPEMVALVSLAASEAFFALVKLRGK